MTAAAAAVTAATAAAAALVVIAAPTRRPDPRHRRRRRRRSGDGSPYFAPLAALVSPRAHKPPSARLAFSIVLTQSAIIVVFAAVAAFIAAFYAQINARAYARLNFLRSRVVVFCQKFLFYQMRACFIDNLTLLFLRSHVFLSTFFCLHAEWAATRI